ncbi:aromatic prenyltransferase [Aspergillus pseudotamarii]|uniref:Aromatic prenyltransferase n=1 Tax=Aspergillus pseudotamarii TaxID=132259 RepID=A0A5N6SXS0_ASPPS|nr:aromatic prenyltransferase [Aspergillus pseudotamarii]KAE8138183.1 aromatic prenyltransferase [Aspergillus pseudotamarii]
MSTQKSDTCSPHQALARGIGFKNNHERLWWATLGPLLEKLLALCDYPVSLQYQHLSFIYYHILPYLGPYPSIENGFAWKTAYSPDTTPAEVSLNFDGSKKAVRMDHVPISQWSGTPKDPFCQNVALELTNSLASMLPDFSMDWFDYFVQQMYIPDSATDIVLAREPPNFRRMAIQSVNGCDLLDSGVRVKPVFNALWKSLETGIPHDQLLFDSIRNNGDLFGAYHPALQVIGDYCQSDRAREFQTKGCFLSFDTTNSKDARLKVYLHGPQTAYIKMRDAFTLGGRLNNPNIQTGVKELRKLWYAVLNLPPDFPETEDLPVTDDLYQGWLVNYELRPNNHVPEPKVYIPVAINNKDQDSIVQGLQEFFSHHESMDVQDYRHIFESLLYVCPNLR